MKIVDDPALDPAERDRRFTELLARNVDTPRIARFVLGRYWNSASDRERKEFVGVYPPYLAKAFAGRLGQFAGAIVSVSSTKRLDDDIRIKTNIHFVGPRPSSASTSEWEIGWLVRSTPDGFKIEDVDIQGASLRLHERTNLMTLIATAGETVAGLIKVIRGSLGGSGRS
jgi:phospholipid transport system substrate-binding protein